MISGHYTGELAAAIDKAAQKTSGADGSFYSILNKHGFYDINDENNGLTQWQRDMVPDYNQHRMSELSTAISEMIQDYLGNSSYGVLAVKLEKIINKIDGFLTCTKAQNDSIKAGMASTGALSGIAASADLMYTVNTALMGLDPFDIDILPPITIGLGGLPISIGSCFPTGHFPGDWSFLYEHEEVKSTTIYESNGALYIGPGIPLNIGGSNKPIILKNMFSVITVDEYGVPQGDVVAGITEEQFELILSASEKTSKRELSDNERALTLTTPQMRLAYYKYVQMSLWGAITYKENWPYYHWGMLAHNSCPTDVKTAVCSYLKTNGLAISNDINPEAGYISYCLKVGMYYKLGYSKPFMFCPLKGDSYILNEEKVTATSNTVTAIQVEGVPKSEELSIKYFTYIADILSRLTNASSPAKVDVAMRKRRVDEATLIYNYVGYNGPEYGTELSKIDTKCLRVSMLARNFDGLLKAQIMVHANNKTDNTPMIPVTIENKAPEGEMSTRTINVITELARKAGVRYLLITSLYRSPERQGEIMFNQMQKTGQPTVKYGSRGQAVCDEYARVWYKYYGNGNTGLKPKYYRDGTIMKDESGNIIYVQSYAKGPFEPDSIAAKEAKQAMINKCKSFGTSTPVSNHTKDEDDVQCVDITVSTAYVENPKVTEAQLRRFASICYMSSEPYKDTEKGKLDNTYPTLLSNFMAPKGFGPIEEDPALHLEISQTDTTLKAYDSDTMDTDKLMPTVTLVLKNTNLTNDANWNTPYAKDHSDTVSV